MDRFHWGLIFVLLVCFGFLVWLSYEYASQPPHSSSKAKDAEMKKQFYWGCRPKIEFAWRTKDGDVFNQLYVRNASEGTLTPIPLVQRIMDAELDFTENSLNITRQNCDGRVVYVGSFNYTRPVKKFCMRSNVTNKYVSFDSSTMMRRETEFLTEAAEFVLVDAAFPHKEISYENANAGVLYVPALERYVDADFNAKSTNFSPVDNAFEFAGSSLKSASSSKTLENLSVAYPSALEPKIVLFTSDSRAWHVQEPVVENVFVCDVRTNIRHRALRNGAKVGRDISGCPIDDSIATTVFTMGKASDTFNMIGENNLEIETVNETEKGKKGLVILAEALIFDSLVHHLDHSLFSL